MAVGVHILKMAVLLEDYDNAAVHDPNACEKETKKVN